MGKLLFFHHIFEDMESKIFSNEAFFTQCLSTDLALKSMLACVSKREFFFIEVANLTQNATGLVGNLKTFKICFFLEK